MTENRQKNGSLNRDLLNFLYEITLLAIDIDNIECLEPFLPLCDHFKIRRFLGLK